MKAASIVCSEILHIPGVVSFTGRDRDRNIGSGASNSVYDDRYSVYAFRDRDEEPDVPDQNSDILSLPGLVAITLDSYLEFHCASDRDFDLYSVQSIKDSYPVTK